MPAEYPFPFPLRPRRVHEAGGPLAASLAAASAARAGDSLWVRPHWLSEMPNPAGLSAWLDPSRLLLAQARDQTEVLAVAEDALRDGAAPLVVITLTKSLSLTAGRRLQLAAEAGGATGLCLIPEGMGSPAAETRWHCAPVFDARTDAQARPNSTLQCWRLIKNKEGTLGAWHVRWDATARRLVVVSPVGQRPGSAGAPD